jgi:hypothetical protein
MGRRLLLIGLTGLVSLSGFVACDKSSPLADLDAGPSAGPAMTPLATGSAAPDAAAPDAGHPMPTRPVPTSSPTVLVTMPIDVQLQAIQYMAAMQAPRPGDAAADPTYAKSIASSLRGAGKPDVVGDGRRIDVLLEKGCDATLPKQLIARSTGASLTTLLAHGVLVVRCADHNLQCLQSTRDGDDVLCTHK